MRWTTSAGFSVGYVKADLRENPIEAGKATLAQCVSQFLMVRYEPEQITNNRTLVQEKQILGSLTARYGNAPIDSLTHREIETWLRGINKAPVTLSNKIRIGVFWN
jgi:hypothetical protein